MRFRRFAALVVALTALTATSVQAEIRLTSDVFAQEVAAAAQQTALGVVQPLPETVLSSPQGAYTASTSLPKFCSPRYRVGLIANPQPCTLGDTTSSTSIVLVGSSHAGMWSRALSKVALDNHFALKTFIYTSCVPIITTTPLPPLTPVDPKVTATTCATWNSRVGKAIDALRPAAVFIGSGTEFDISGETQTQWTTGLAAFIDAIHVSRKYIIGSSPRVTTAGEVAQCLVTHRTAITLCATRVNLRRALDPTTALLRADRTVARATGAELLDVTPLLCTPVAAGSTSLRCPAVIDGRLVYVNGSHLSVGFTSHVQSVFQPVVAKL